MSRHPGYLRTVCRHHRAEYVRCEDVLEEETYCAICVLEQERDGAMADREIVEAKLGEAEKHCDVLVLALKEAMKLIRVWHGDIGWDIYDRSSPEMKRLHSG